MASLGVDFTTYTRSKTSEDLVGTFEVARRRLVDLCVWKYKEGPAYEYRCPHFSVAATVWYLNPLDVISFHENLIKGKHSAAKYLEEN